MHAVIEKKTVEVVKTETVDEIVVRMSRDDALAIVRYLGHRSANSATGPLYSRLVGLVGYGR